MSQPSHSDIANRAYQIWVEEGRPHGRDRDHWQRAEREIHGGAAKDSRTADLRGAEQNSRQTEAASLGRPGHPAAPSMTQAAASTTKRVQQAPGSQPTSKSAQAQTQAGQAAGNKAQQSSGKAEPQSGEKSQGANARRPRAPRQSNP